MTDTPPVTTVTPAEVLAGINDLRARYRTSLAQWTAWETGTITGGAAAADGTGSGGPYYPLTDLDGQTSWFPCLAYYLSGSPVKVRGTVATVAALPATGNILGDLYLVSATSPAHGYVWFGSSWSDIGPFQGPTGAAGPANTLSIGTVATGASAAASITGSSPTQTLNLTLPKGDTGGAGPANTLAIGTVTSGATPAATITGSSPAQTLNLILPKGDVGGAGPANTLAIGAVTAGAAAATITGTAPNQTLNLTLPPGAKGDGATVAVGSVTTGDPGTAVQVTNSGSSSAVVLDFVIPKGPKGDSGTGSGNLNYQGTPTAGHVLVAGPSANTVADGGALAAVALSGLYTDLTGAPALAPVATSGVYADLTGKPTLFSGAYQDLTGKPVLSTVAISGVYNDLTGKPTLGSLAALSTVTLTTNVTGVLPLANGGTGASTASAARTALGLGTAATLNAGTAAGDAVQLDGSGKLPAVDGSQLTGIAAGGGGSTATLVANSAITVTGAPVPVVLRGDGKIDPILGSGTTAGVDTAAALAAGANQVVSFDPQGFIVVASTRSSDHAMQVSTYQPSATPGTGPTLIATTAITAQGVTATASPYYQQRPVALAYNPNTGKHLVACCLSTSVYAYPLTISSAGAITVGDLAYTLTGAAQAADALALSYVGNGPAGAVNKLLLVHHSCNASGASPVISTSLLNDDGSAGTTSTGTPASASAGFLAAATDAAGNVVLIAGAGPHTYARAYVPGSGIGPESADLGEAYGGDLVLTPNGLVFVNVGYSADQYIYARKITVSGASVSAGGKAVLRNTGTAYTAQAVYSTRIAAVALSFIDNASALNAMSFTFDGTTFTPGAVLQVATGSTSDNPIGNVSNQHRKLVDDTVHGKFEFVTETNLRGFNVTASITNAGSYIGFAKASVAAAATGTVSLAGSVLTGFTGLTPRADYYLAADGSLTTTPTPYAKVGRALTATTLWMRDGVQ